MNQDQSDRLYWRKACEAFSSERLELTILPTEQCNFRCIYCYEDFAIGAMSSEVVQGIKNLLSQRASGLRVLMLRWFGGEPLLAFNVIDEVMSHVQRLGQQYPLLSCYGAMTTNASLLTLERADQLCHLGVRAFQITLDGPKEWHDRTRVTRSGSGSFERIHANLVALRDSKLPFRIELRLHLTPLNYPYLAAYVENLDKQYLDDPRFTLEFFPVEKLGGPNDDHFEVLDHDLALAAISQLRSRLRIQLPTVAEVGDHYVCYAAMPNAFVIRADGRIGKCTTALSDVRNDIGRLNEDGSIVFNQDLARAWLKGWSGRDWQTLQCPLMSLTEQDMLIARRSVLES